MTGPDAGQTGHSTTTENRYAAVRLFGYSFLILFFELALIRFIPGHIRIVAYVVNLVLMASFLGMGVGLLLQKRRAWIEETFPLCLLGVVAVCWYFGNIIVASPDSREEGFYAIYYDLSPQSRVLGMEPVVAIVFIASTLVFVPLGRALAVEFERFSPLRAYSINIIGSLSGIGVFALMSSFSTPPLYWFAFGFAGYLALNPCRRAWLLSIPLFAAALWATQSLSRQGNEIWSPYYKINVFRDKAGHYDINVNGSIHQFMVDFSTAARDAHIAEIEQGYRSPYRFVKKPDDVLILGAGSGNDVVMALKQNASHVDAVEIDPDILDLGRRLNPQKPYDDPRVTVYNDDARAYLKKTDKKYDAIILGTLDSQTLLSGMSSIRLDNYAYTLEAFRTMREHLKPEGVLILYHLSQVNRFSFKLHRMLRAVFPATPRINHSRRWGLFNFILVAGVPEETEDDQFVYGFEEPRNSGDSWVGYVLPTDDWPYLYLPDPGVPSHYWKIGGAIAAISLLFVGLALGADNLKRPDAPMFFLGAGFLLLETKSVTEMSLLFGSTWQVNILVFASILMLILCANAIVLRFPALSVDRLFLLLFGFVLLCFLIPARDLLGLNRWGQWVAAGLMTAAPLFAAGMIFARLFATRTATASSLGYNLVGAILGGLLEYSSMAFGTKSLYLISLMMYFFAYRLQRRELG